MNQVSIVLTICSLLLLNSHASGNLFSNGERETVKGFMKQNDDTSNHPQVHSSQMFSSSSSFSSAFSSPSSTPSTISTLSKGITNKESSFDSIAPVDSHLYGESHSQQQQQQREEEGVKNVMKEASDSTIAGKDIGHSASASPSLGTNGLLRSLGCASPEVLVNGSPSPDILETVNGGKSGMGKIQEIQFVGVVDVGGREKKRICKIKCLNGVWVGPLCTLEPECPRINSTHPKLLMSLEGTKIYDRAHFSCIDGLQLVGADEITCTADGVWSHAVPVCRVVECPEVDSDDPNLTIIQPTNRTLASKISFECSEGHRLIGAPFSICQSNNTWSSDVPYCQPISCPEPLVPANGTVIKNANQLRVGDSIEYQCDQRFVLDGERISICMKNGSWSTAVPQCKAVCEYPGEPKNGYIVPTRFHYSIGEGISVICKSSRSHLGPTFIYCTPQGSWSSPLPICASDDDELDEDADDNYSDSDDSGNSAHKSKLEGKESSSLIPSDHSVERSYPNHLLHSSKVNAKQTAVYQMNRQVPHNKAYLQGHYKRYSNNENDNNYPLHKSRDGDNL